MPKRKKVGISSWQKWLRLGWQHPQLACQKIKEKFKFKWRRYYDYRRLDGTAPPPVTIGFNLTFLCNLRCLMCGQWGERGMYRTRDKESLREVISIERLKEIVDEISPFHPDIYVWGGEPLLYPKVLEFTSYIKGKKLICNINTNGTLLSRYGEDMVKIGLDGLNISIDGPAEVHDAIRGGETFDRIMEGVHATDSAKKKNKTHRPMLKVICTLSEMNYKHTEELIKLVSSESSLESLSFLWGWFTTEEIGLRNSQVFEKLFGCQSTSWKGFVDACGNPDVSELQRLKRSANKRRESTLITFLPSITAEQLPMYYRQPDIPIGKDRCISPWVTADIRPNGDVTFCPDYPDYIIGNVKESKFIDIWNSQRACRFRNALQRYKLFPICSRCCGLYL